MVRVWACTLHNDEIFQCFGEIRADLMSTLCKIVFYVPLYKRFCHQNSGTLLMPTNAGHLTLTDFIILTTTTHALFFVMCYFKPHSFTYFIFLWHKVQDFVSDICSTKPSLKVPCPCMKHMSRFLLYIFQHFENRMRR